MNSDLGVVVVLVSSLHETVINGSSFFPVVERHFSHVVIVVVVVIVVIVVVIDVDIVVVDVVVDVVVVVVVDEDRTTAAVETRHEQIKNTEATPFFCTFEALQQILKHAAGLHRTKLALAI